MKRNVYAEIHDSLMDATAWMTDLTDMDEPHLGAAKDVSLIVRNLSEALHMLKGASAVTEEHQDAGHSAPVEEHETWGNADPQARRLFEKLAKHYMGFWKCAAAYKAEPSDEWKNQMLGHFEHLLQAHTALSSFVMTSCPALCPEIKAILASVGAAKKTD